MHVFQQIFKQSCVLPHAEFTCILGKVMKMSTVQEIWYIYLAQCRDKTLYCGITNNLIKRFWQHNGMISGGAKYTKGRRPVTLLAFHSVNDKSVALKLEIAIKKLPKPKKLTYLLNLQNKQNLPNEQNTMDKNH